MFTCPANSSDRQPARYRRRLAAVAARPKGQWLAFGAALLLCLGSTRACPAAPVSGGNTQPAAMPVQHRPAWQKDRVALEQRFVQDEFRIFYTLTGPNALPATDRTDSDRDGVPDKIQDIARQLVVARRCFVEVLGLRHPLESPRYKGRVKFIEVNVWALENKNGSAGDAIVNYHRPCDPPEGVEVVTIDLAAKLRPGNLTPAHELFHVFQNGYSLFKNPWYYEGMARWSEDLLRAGTGTAGTLPADAAALENLFKQSYDASRFWQALARATDPAGKVTVPPDLRELRSLGSSKPIIEDDTFHGAALMKALLEEFDREDDGVSREQNLNPLDWPEARQRATENNRHLWNAVIKAARRFPAAAPQLQRMAGAAKARLGIGFGLGRQTGDLAPLMKGENDFVDTMARGAGLAEMKRLTAQGVKVACVFLSLQQMRESIAMLKANDIQCAYLAYNPEQNQHTPRAELDDFVGSVKSARKLADEYGARLVVGPGMRFISSREGDYARAAPYVDAWLIQSQRFQIHKETARHATPEEYRHNIQRVANLIHQGNPRTKIWVQIIVCPGARPGNDFPAEEIVALARSIEDIVDAVRIYTAGAKDGVGTLKEVIRLMR
jgi:hypothetical protein